MDNIKKHLEKLNKAIDAKLGKGYGNKLLKKYENVTGNESPKEIAKIATSLSKQLEKNIDIKYLKEIREECACIKANKYSAYNKKYFPELRAKFPNNDEKYLEAVYVFPEKECNVDIIETFATGGTDCVFRTSFIDK